MNACMLFAHHREYVKDYLHRRFLKFKSYKAANVTKSQLHEIRIMPVHYVGLQPLCRALNVIDLQ